MFAFLQQVVNYVGHQDREYNILATRIENTIAISVRKLEILTPLLIRDAYMKYGVGVSEV